MKPEESLPLITISLYFQTGDFAAVIQGEDLLGDTPSWRMLVLRLQVVEDILFLLEELVEVLVLRVRLVSALLWELVVPIMIRSKISDIYLHHCIHLYSLQFLHLLIAWIV